MITSKDIMTSDVVTIEAKETMSTAYRIMKEKNIRHLPVVDCKRTVVGILSDRDVQLSMSVKRVNQFQQSVSIGEDSLVEDYMSWPVYVMSEETSIRRIAEEMLSQKVSAFLVQDFHGKLKGIITTDDLIKLFLTEKPVRPELPIKSLTKEFFRLGNLL